MAANLKKTLFTLANTGKLVDLKAFLDVTPDLHLIINSTDDKGETPLIKSVSNGQIGKIKALVEKGADVNVEDQYGYSILEHVSDSIFNYLLSKGANIHHVNPKNGMTLLHSAVTSYSDNRFNIFNKLMDLGINVNVVNSNGFTPLMYAVDGRVGGALERILPLVDDINQTNIYGNSALSIASFDGKLSAVNALLQAGADVNIQNLKGETPLIQACIKNNLGITHALLHAGADVNIQNLKGETPLILVSSQGITKIVQELIAREAHLDIISNGETALMKASEKGHIEAVRALLQAGADFTIKNAEGKDAHQLAKTPEIKALFIPYIKESLPKWKGFTQSDISKFDTIFDTDPDPATGSIGANDNAVCPVCLKFVSRGEACMYMKHNCSESPGFYHKELYEKYKNADGLIGWCTICGRPATGHRHHLLNLPTDPKAALGTGAGQPFENDCRLTNGGGGLPEKMARFRRLREYAFQIQKLLAKGKTFTEEEVLTKMVEEVWKAPLFHNPFLNTIAENKTWNINIPTTSFPPNARLRSDINEKIANYENVRWENKDLIPTIVPHGTDTLYGDEDVDVLHFKHRQDDGTIKDHADRIGVNNFVDWLKDMVTKKFGAPEFGYCYMYPSCKAKIYPGEIESLLKSGHVEKSLYDNYRKLFNERHGGKPIMRGPNGNAAGAHGNAAGAHGNAAGAHGNAAGNNNGANGNAAGANGNQMPALEHVGPGAMEAIDGGRRRKTRKVKKQKQKGGGGDFFQPATDAVCVLPKKGGKRNTRKLRKSKNKKSKTTRK